MMILRILHVFDAFLLLILAVTFAKKDPGGFKVTVLANSTASLPCLPTAEIKGAAAIIVLWYKNQNPEPFYSYDLRQERDGGRHWSDESVFGRRVQFDSSERPLRLRVKPTLPKDQGSYRCRVDYESGPSITALVQLKVIVLPRSLSIVDEEGISVEGKIGPYLEGKGTILTCSTLGGRPSPSLTWLRGNRIIETSFNVDPRGIVRSLLHLQHLTRDLLDVSYTCRAENNNETKPLERTVTIDMTLAPLHVILRRKEGSVLYVREGKLEELECVTVGSRPEPLLTWYKNGIKVITANITELRMMNRTISTLPIVPNLTDQDSMITCRALNPLLPDEGLETSLKLNVHFSPKVKLLKGSGLDPTSVKEGADFYFDCVVSANPSVYKITWLQQGRPIGHNISARIIILNQTLVLQDVGRRSAGNYQCKAINLRGYGISNKIKLNVLYSPVCSTEAPIHIEVHHKATANITCSVEAEPRNTSFKWQFNSSGGIIEIDTHRFSTKDTTSVLPYTPASPGDYGLLLCFAENDIGKQERPCVINVTAAEPPKLIESCHISNQTSHSLLIICKEVNTKLNPSFKLEVLNLEDQSVVSFIQNKTAKFLASGLTPRTAYELKITANSTLGESRPIKLRAFTVKTAEKRMGVHQHQEEDAELTLVPLVSGIIAILIISISLIILIFLKVCRRRRRDLPKDNDSHLSSFTQEDHLRFDSSLSESNSKTFTTRIKENSSPDLIPAGNNGTQYQLRELAISPTYDLKKQLEVSFLASDETTNLSCLSGHSDEAANLSFLSGQSGVPSSNPRRCIHEGFGNQMQDTSSYCSIYPSNRSDKKLLESSRCELISICNPPPPGFQDITLDSNTRCLKQTQPLKCYDNQIAKNTS